MDPARLPSSTTMTVQELGDWSFSTVEIRSLVSVEGYTAREGNYDVPNQTVKYLLYSGLENGGRRGVFPAVMLFFKKEVWDVEVSYLR